MKFVSTRRTFLGTAGAAGLAAVTPASLSAHVEPAPWGIKLGVATYSLRKFDRPKAIEMLKVLKTGWVSVKDVHLKYTLTPAELKEAVGEFQAAGIKVASAGNVDMTKATTIEAIRPAFEYAKNAGIPMLVCAPTHDNIKMVETLVKEYNIRIAIHTHGPEDKHFPTPKSVMDVVRNMDPRCGMCMDVGHSTRAGANVVKEIPEAGARLFDMHVKDLTDPHNKDITVNGAKVPSQCDIGDGELDFPGIFKALKKMNYQGNVNMEYEINDNEPLEGMRRSLSYMRGVLAALAEA